MNTTQEQKTLILQWMKLNPEVARGRLRRKGESRNEMKKLLENLAKTINAANVGPIKSSAEWLKTWKDWKTYVLKKETKRRNHSLTTGGGSPLNIYFSPLEEDLLNFITPETAGIDNIPQGGIYLDDTCIETDLDEEDKENSHFEKNKQLPQKRLYKNYEFQSNTGKKQLLSPKTMSVEENAGVSTMRSLSPEVIYITKKQKDSNSQLSNEMLNLYKEKLQLKKDELVIQRQLLDVQRAMLSELQEIRNTVDTFGRLE